MTQHQPLIARASLCLFVCRLIISNCFIPGHLCENPCDQRCRDSEICQKVSFSSYICLLWRILKAHGFAFSRRAIVVVHPGPEPKWEDSVIILLGNSVAHAALQYGIKDNQMVARIQVQGLLLGFSNWINVPIFNLSHMLSYIFSGEMGFSCMEYPPHPQTFTHSRTPLTSIPPAMHKKGEGFISCWCSNPNDYVDTRTKLILQPFSSLGRMKTPSSHSCSAPAFTSTPFLTHISSPFVPVHLTGGGNNHKLFWLDTKMVDVFSTEEITYKKHLAIVQSWWVDWKGKDMVNHIAPACPTGLCRHTKCSCMGHKGW